METPDRFSVPALIETGLSEADAKSLAAWVETGKAGIAISKAPGFLTMYLVGMSIDEICATFPEIPRNTILYESIRSSWRQLREQFQSKAMAGVAENAITAKADTINLVSQILQATGSDWRKQLLRYLANPEKEKRPDFLPESISQLAKLTEMLKSLTEQPAGKGQPGALVNVNVGAGGEVKVVNPQDVKAALMKDLGKG